MTTADPNDWNLKLANGWSLDELFARVRRLDDNVATCYASTAEEVNEHLVVRSLRVEQKSTGYIARMTLAMWEREPDDADPHDSSTTVSLKIGDLYAVWVWDHRADLSPAAARAEMAVALKVFEDLAGLIGAKLTATDLQRWWQLDVEQQIEVTVP